MTVVVEVMDVRVGVSGCIGNRCKGGGDCGCVYQAPFTHSSR